MGKWLPVGVNGLFWDDENDLKLDCDASAQLCKLKKKYIELYTLNGSILGHINYISMKLLKMQGLQ